MAERPILFSAPMIKALLAGRKTQTRRLITDKREWAARAIPKVQRFAPSADGWWTMAVGEPSRIVHCGHEMDGGHIGSIRCPYGVPGDRLWVRETWAPHADEEEAARNWTAGTPFSSAGCRQLKPDVFFRADGGDPFINRWRPSIHMPRWASRLTMEITDVRVQRLQEISEEDSRAEGVEHEVQVGGGLVNDGYYRSKFSMLWDSINGERATWASNPWVWAVSFRVAEVRR